MFESGHRKCGLRERCPRTSIPNGTLTDVRVARCLSLFVWICVAAWPAAVLAQPYESVGLRALGMGGAFVAMADDASATYWNPAGLATGRFFSFVFDTGRTQSDAERVSGSLIAVGTPPLGVAYYRLSSTAVSPAGPDGDEQSEVARLRTSHVGVTLVQTLLDGLHLGATLKYVHGAAAQGVGPADLDDPLDAASSLSASGGRAFDVDVGLMADLGRVRAGLAVRNLLEPTFDTPGQVALELPRQVRAGVAVFPTATLSLAADADLTSAPDIGGARRSLAVGAEQRLWRERIGLRGGLRFSTLGETRTAVTAGASAAIRTGVYGDAYVAVGVGGTARTGGGVGVRVIF